MGAQRTTPGNQIEIVYAYSYHPRPSMVRAAAGFRLLLSWTPWTRRDLSVVKRSIGVPRAIPASALIVVVFAVLLFWLLDTKFRRFKHQSAKYHAEVAAACDFMLIGTNKAIELSVADASLPEMVRRLRPCKIKLAANWVWIWVDDSHTDGLNVTWEPQDETHTNIWNLIIGNGEGPSEVVYVANR